MLDAPPPHKHEDALAGNDIAVIGMSCKVAGADDLGEFWKTLCAGKSQHVEVPMDRFSFESSFRKNDSERKWYGNFIEDYDAFDHKFFKKSPREMASTDPQQRLMLSVTYQAVEQSGYFRSSKSDKHIGCYVGVGTVDYENNIACYPPNAFSATGNLKSFVAGKISHYFGWTGPALTIDTACSASAVAVHQACKAILGGECIAAIAGGATIITGAGWFQNLAGASFLSPTGPCKPFDAKADGYCRGEGIGAVFLKSMSSATADGDQILGVVRGTSVYQNLNHTPITVPNAESLSTLFQDVIRQASLRPEQISVVEAHGTGTAVGDPAEYESVRRVLGSSNRSHSLSLGSVKGLVGHTECASGIIALIKTILMIHEGVIPPQASFDMINPEIDTSLSDEIEIPTSLMPWNADFRAALINNYGASGSNASIVVSQPPSLSFDVISSISTLASDARHPFWLCGFSDQSLRLYSAKLRRFLLSKNSSDEKLSIPNLAFNIFRQSNRSLSRALIFTCDSLTELDLKLHAFEHGDNGIVAVERPSPRPVILCFGSQMSAFAGLDQKLYESVRILRTHLDRCNSICQSIGVGGIYPFIFQKTPIEDMVKRHTALFAMQYSCARCWMDCGVEVAAVIGYSLGDLTALCISGLLSLKDTIRLIADRARLVRDTWGPEKGCMIAVEAELEDVERILEESRKSCEGDKPATIACYDGPRNFTIAGSVRSIDTFAELLSTYSIPTSTVRTKKLDVANAYHCALVDPLTIGLNEITQNVEFGKSKFHFERAVGSESVEVLTPRFVAENMRHPVYFSQAVKRLSKQYPSGIWLEAGSNTAITAIANAALESKGSCLFQPINITSADGLQNLTDATTALWKEGVNVMFWPHHSSQANEYTPLLLPPYQFEKSKHWMVLKKPPKAVAEVDPQKHSVEWTLESLWTFVGYCDQEQHHARFQVNTMSKKFEVYVKGHTIAQTIPLCPSTLQLDIVIEALRDLRPDFAHSNLQPRLQNLENLTPMCIDIDREVWLEAHAKDAASHVWDWKMLSNAKNDTSAISVHVTGSIIFESTDDTQLYNDFTRYERLVGHERCLQLLDGNDADDIIKGRNVYKVFAEIVDYGEIYRGVEKIAAQGHESAGRVVKAYTGETWLDTPLSDCFCQVAGIYVNCMTDQSDKELRISNRIEQWIRSPTLRLGDSRPGVWDVYACHRRPSGKEFVSDIFIFDPRNGALMEMILGVGYQTVSKAALGKVLSRLTTSRAKPENAATLSPSSHLPTSKITAPPIPELEKKISSQLNLYSRIKELLCSVAGVASSQLKNDTILSDIGIDSLMGMELAKEIEQALKCSLSMAQIVDVTDFQSLVKCIMTILGANDEGSFGGDEICRHDLSVCQDDKSSQGSSELATPDSEDPTPQTPQTSVTSFEEDHSPNVANGLTIPGTQLNTDIARERILETFAESKRATDNFITKYKFHDYVDSVLPKQTKLCIAHIVEAFEVLGCSLKTAKPDQELRRIQYLPRHERFINLLYAMLEKRAQLISVEGSCTFRTAISSPTKSAKALLQDLIRDFPDHANDYRLTHLVGSKLADCLIGKADGVQLIFGSSEGRELVSGLYGRSPINMVWLKQMEDLLKRLFSKLSKFKLDGPIKILEMGAGTGGTTAGMASLLASLDVSVEYTFTDLSPSLVAAARKQFQGYPFMRFRTHDIEKPPASDLLHNQHIVIANNCVHATRNLEVSTGNIRRLLRPDGFLMMVEMTTDKLDWVDLVFGPLDGWWMFDDERRHAVAGEEIWEKALRRAGYGHVDWTEGSLPEANLQRIIIALAS